ncbi:PhzF family phenazine biosynthesis protein [Staphylococcus casei]|uniref:PhzF family phenazine biosynthesis protein n=1 Tax=Staphylococcus TaxID=1279 RepID=UPI000D1D95B7|nr:PhzF family phenazine biosynthesis protein [Staphylococcus casei]PTI76186.1 PhzF family phenazine biosynthesis protein [Staphylococcus succinus]WJE85529.1 PhzF family phenazine biosynthesis protein [Staphylococcus casei]
MEYLNFKQVDVFPNEYFKGNPVAVVFDSDNLSTNQMQNIANWTGLSETTFVCKPKNKNADYKLRIFTSNRELPFAGHPTLGSAHAVLDNGLIAKNKNVLIQECGAGLIKIDINKDKMYFSLPEPKINDIPFANLSGLANSLNITTEDIIYSKNINIGAEWLTLNLKNADIVKKIEPDFIEMKKYLYDHTTGVTIFGEHTDLSEAKFEVRSFCPQDSVQEDPVCGSGNGCVAVMADLYHLANEKNYINTQGSCINRNGKIYIDNGEKLKLGGQSKVIIDGKIIVPKELGKQHF